MLHPSYNDLIATVNKNVEAGEEPIITSRYSIVLAAAKRARQIVSGDEPRVADAKGKKPLSIAVEELEKSEVQILRDGDEAEVETVETAVEETEEAAEEETAAEEATEE